MKTFARLSILCLSCTSFAVHAGVVYEMATRTVQGQELERMTFYDEGDDSRMDQSGSESGSMTVIFKEEGFYVLDHAEKSYVLMDEAMLDQISSQINSAMQEMEAQLAAMPADQRAMVRQMLEREMPGLGSGAVKGPVFEIEPAGEGRWKSYDCNKYDMLEDGVKIQEICATDYKFVDGSGSLRNSFSKMGEFLNKLYDAIPFGGEGARNPLEIFNRIDGFPVHTIEFENGVAVSEMTLESTRQEDIDSSMFTLPADYKRVDPFKQ